MISSLASIVGGLKSFFSAVGKFFDWLGDRNLERLATENAEMKAELEARDRLDELSKDIADWADDDHSGVPDDELIQR